MSCFDSAFLQYMDNLSHQYKAPFISWMGTNCFLYVNDPQSVEQIFNSTHCTNKGDFYRFMSSAIGDGLFTSSCKLCSSSNSVHRSINSIHTHSATLAEASSSYQSRIWTTNSVQFFAYFQCRGGCAVGETGIGGYTAGQKLGDLSNLEENCTRGGMS